MFLGGLWHGASWNFVIWGILHGSYLAIHKAILDKFPSLKNCIFFKSRIGKIVSIIITQYFVFLAWIPFRVKDFDHMVYSMEKFIFIDFSTNVTQQISSFPKLPLVLIALFLILHFISYSKPNIIERISKLDLWKWTIFLIIILGAIVFFFDGNPEDFIYFRF